MDGRTCRPRNEESAKVPSAAGLNQRVPFLLVLFLWACKEKNELDLALRGYGLIPTNIYEDLYYLLTQPHIPWITIQR